jgi:hypothetical protein
MTINTPVACSLLLAGVGFCFESAGIFRFRWSQQITIVSLVVSRRRIETFKSLAVSCFLRNWREQQERIGLGITGHYELGVGAQKVSCEVCTRYYYLYSMMDTVPALVQRTSTIQWIGTKESDAERTLCVTVSVNVSASPQTIIFTKKNTNAYIAIACLWTFNIQ